MNKLMAFVILTSALFINSFCQTTMQTDSSRELPYDQKIGGSGVVEVGLTSLDLEPVKKIVKEDLDKGGFNFDKNTFTTLGIVGYVGQRRNGLRVGFGGWVGYNSLYSDKWTSRVSEAEIKKGSDSLVDSVVQLHLIFAHTGLVVERSFKVFKNLNLYAGSMIGGGFLAAVEDRKLSNNAFSNHKNNNNNNDDDSTDTDNYRTAWAPLWAFDLHGGFTYSFTKWLHIGLDGSALAYYSASGFQSKYGSFWSINPGIRLRLVFGTSA